MGCENHSLVISRWAVGDFLLAKKITCGPHKSSNEAPLLHCTKYDLAEALKKFAAWSMLLNAVTCIFFFSGHGCQIAKSVAAIRASIRVQAGPAWLRKSDRIKIDEAMTQPAIASKDCCSRSSGRTS